jgi:hypothetical protein
MNTESLVRAVVGRLTATEPLIVLLDTGREYSLTDLRQLEDDQAMEDELGEAAPRARAFADACAQVKGGWVYLYYPDGPPVEYIMPKGWALHAVPDLPPMSPDLERIFALSEGGP